MKPANPGRDGPSQPAATGGRSPVPRAGLSSADRDGPPRSRVPEGRQAGPAAGRSRTDLDGPPRSRVPGGRQAGPAAGRSRTDLDGPPRSGGPGDRTGQLILAAVPIGRADDASSRLAAAMARVPVIAAEDTRRLRRLAAAMGITLAGRVVSYYEDVEAARGPVLLAALAEGEDVLLVTDAGMPGISDPGYRLVTAAIEAGIAVTVLPGPSAVTAAVAVSGLPTDRFCFEGFPPRRAGERARRLAGLRDEPRTLVFFESPRRLAATLAELSGALGADRRAAVCRELTKTHEEVRRGSLGELAEWASRGVLGEITLVVGGAPAPAGTASAEEAAAEVGALEQAGVPRKDAIAQTATRLGLPKREVYDAVIRARSRPRWP